MELITAKQREKIQRNALIVAEYNALISKGAAKTVAAKLVSENNNVSERTVFAVVKESLKK